MLARLSSAIFIIVLLLQISGCEKEKGIGRYGMLEENTPEYTAVMFIRGIYNDDDIDRALALSTERMERLLQRYHTQSNIQRHLFNLKYDTVEVTPQSGQSVGRTEFADVAVITLFFSGTYDGDKIEDLRTLDLKRVDGNWRVDNVQADPFL